MANDFVEQLKNKQELDYFNQEVLCKKLYGPNVINDQRPSMYNETLKKIMCPAYWDTIYCWPPTPANSTIVVGCPSYVTGFIEKNDATRNCNADGSWFSFNNKSWTNYTRCVPGNTPTVLMEIPKSEYISRKLQETLPAITMISQTGYAASLISLIIAFTIMFLIKKLHCARNILHMNLFASFILRAFILILKDILFYQGLGTAEDFVNINGKYYFNINVETSNYKCKLLTSLAHYFTSANYSWILMEGLYLNNLIFRALFADSSKNIVHYVILGWGMPLLVVIPWIIARIWLEDSLCWTSQENNVAFLIIAIPTIISILINFVLFVIISIVLYSKLRSPINEDSCRYKKWAKSTLVLMPLFGVHYSIFLVFYFVRKAEDTIELIWLICDQLFGSFQGFFVAILYCFLNGEVKSELKPHMCSILTYMATRKYLRFCFPCREKYLRSAVGRTSVCTTMSCSSLYTNGLIHHRNSKTKSTDAKIKHLNSSVEKRDHICANGKNINGMNKQNTIFNTNGTAETTLMTDTRHEKYIADQIIIEEEIILTKNFH